VKFELDETRVVVVLSERDLYELVLKVADGAEPLLAGTVNRIDGRRDDEMLVIARVEPNAVHYRSSPPPPLPPASQAFVDWLARERHRQREEAENWTSVPLLSFDANGELSQLLRYGATHLSLERVGEDEVELEVDSVRVLLQAASSQGKVLLHTWFASEAVEHPAFRGITLEGENARRLFKHRRNRQS